jgi:hypothetical protein
MIEIWFGPGKHKSVQANCNALSEVGATDSISYSFRAFVLVAAYHQLSHLYEPSSQRREGDIRSNGS